MIFQFVSPVAARQAASAFQASGFYCFVVDSTVTLTDYTYNKITRAYVPKITPKSKIVKP